MNNGVFPTKSNLIQTKRSLDLAKLGYELLDRKRNIMLREMMELMDTVNEVQSQIDVTFSEAYAALQYANMTIGQIDVNEIADAVDIVDDVTVRFRSVMGVELPDVVLDTEKPKISYGFFSTNEMLDDAYIKFLKVKKLTSQIAAIENSVYRLAHAIKQSQKRANALKNIVIPRLETTSRYITNYLEEKERDEFTTLKVIKSNKLKDED